MSEHNLPTEPGLYWATDKADNCEWNLIVKLYGKPQPILSLQTILFSKTVLECNLWECLPTAENIRFHFPDKLYYGPKIEMPERDPVRSHYEN